jgi:hypothetical protein
VGANEVSYHGGPVMHSSTVHAIYWAPSGYPLTAGYRSSIDGYFQNVANASGRLDNDYSVAAEYGDSTGPAAYKVSSGASVVDTDPYPADGCTDGPLPVCLTDAQLQAEIDKVISDHGWQAGLSTEFFILTPPSVGSCFDAEGTYCAYGAYCAYHSYFTSSRGNGTVVYATEPYGAEPAAPGACDNGPWPSGDDADAELNLISHEQIESITDPLVNAWFDGGFQEVADKCVGDFGPNGGFNEQIGTGHYYLQEEWSNENHACEPREKSDSVWFPAPGRGQASKPLRLSSRARDPHGSIMGYDWFFGDGRSSHGRTVQHVYRRPGVYRVVLRVTDSADNWGFYSRMVRVSRAPAGTRRR